MMMQPVGEDQELASKRQVEESKQAESIDLKFRKQGKERDPQSGKDLGDHNLYCGTQENAKRKSTWRKIGCFERK